jgi:hypothetical protein
VWCGLVRNSFQQARSHARAFLLFCGKDLEDVRFAVGVIGVAGVDVVVDIRVAFGEQLRTRHC